MKEKKIKGFIEKTLRDIEVVPEGSSLKCESHNWEVLSIREIPVPLSAAYYTVIIQACKVCGDIRRYTVL